LDGTFLSSPFENGVAVAAQVLGGIGQVVKDIVSAAGELIDAIGSILHGVHW
jgi:hypothetical protein